MGSFTNYGEDSALKHLVTEAAYSPAATVYVALATAEHMLREADSSPEEAEAIYRLTSLCRFEDRFVIPPAHREQAMEMMGDPRERQNSVGFGFLTGLGRGM